MPLELVWERIENIVRDTLAALPALLVGLLVVALFALLARGLRLLVRRVTGQRRRTRNLGLVLGRLAEGCMLIFGLLVAVTIVVPGFTPANLIGALGIGGIAVGFAFRDIFQNFLAGILLLLTEPFGIGDQIVFQGYEGTVEDIQSRATMIRTYDGRRIVIPNAELFTNSVTVNTAFPQRRIEHEIGIGYGDDPALARRAILEALARVEGVLTEPAPDVLLIGFASSSVTLRLRWWIHPPHRADALEVQDRVLTAIKAALLEHGVDLPFPTQQILWHDQTEATDGDRRRQREGWPTGPESPPVPRTLAGTLEAWTADRQPEDRRLRPQHRDGRR